MAQDSVRATPDLLSMPSPTQSEMGLNASTIMTPQTPNTPESVGKRDVPQWKREMILRERENASKFTLGARAKSRPELLGGRTQSALKLNLSSPSNSVTSPRSANSSPIMLRSARSAETSPLRQPGPGKAGETATDQMMQINREAMTALYKHEASKSSITNHNIAPPFQNICAKNRDLRDVFYTPPPSGGGCKTRLDPELTI